MPSSEKVKVEVRHLLPPNAATPQNTYKGTRGRSCFNEHSNWRPSSRVYDGRHT